MNKIILNFQIACKNVIGLPVKNDVLKWLKLTLPVSHKDTEVTIRLVDEEEIKFLNMIYRGKNISTNVLSFPFDYLLNLSVMFLGDIVICRQIVEYQAKQQGKYIRAHWAHMVIHGLLHLMGEDHTSNDDSLKMESLEKKIMKKLGYLDPY